MASLFKQQCFVVAPGGISSLHLKWIAPDNIATKALHIAHHSGDGGAILPPIREELQPPEAILLPCSMPEHGKRRDFGHSTRGNRVSQDPSPARFQSLRSDSRKLTRIRGCVVR